MKKWLSLVLAMVFSLVFCLPAGAEANDVRGFQASAVYYDQDHNLVVEGYFYNVGPWTISQFKDVELDVRGKDKAFAAWGVFSSPDLEAIKLLTGESKKWKFVMKDPKTVDLSEFTVTNNFDYQFSDPVSLSKGIKVYYNGQLVAFDLTPPTVIGGRTLIPARNVFEKMGAQIGWDAAKQTVTVTRGDKTVKLTVNQQTAFVNGKPVTMDVSAQIINGRTLVPLRFVAEAFDCGVFWGGLYQIITIGE